MAKRKSILLIIATALIQLDKYIKEERAEGKRATALRVAHDMHKNLEYELTLIEQNRRAAIAAAQERVDIREHKARVLGNDAWVLEHDVACADNALRCLG